jgi:hypothetical protein
MKNARFAPDSRPTVMREADMNKWIIGSMVSIIDHHAGHAGSKKVA